ncbi:hypothetical protein CK203_034773 [Vitis vinifera]|uniref:Uncharacterized protein n=1 Tax=Vitis vinifera TaxID=29760 RepID=A0A438IBV1_VITVI|nr:hypothetical protein CK203_034773 [Vitis vinifera]
MFVLVSSLPQGRDKEELTIGSYPQLELKFHLPWLLAFGKFSGIFFDLDIDNFIQWGVVCKTKAQGVCGWGRNFNPLSLHDLGLDYRRIHDVEIIRFVHSLDFMLLQTLFSSLENTVLFSLPLDKRPKLGLDGVGHGRSVCVMCALLVALGVAEDWKNAEKLIREKRPYIQMNALHRKALEEWSKHRLSSPKRNEEMDLYSLKTNRMHRPTTLEQLLTSSKLPRILVLSFDDMINGDSVQFDLLLNEAHSTMPTPSLS